MVAKSYEEQMEHAAFRKASVKWMVMTYPNANGRGFDVLIDQRYGDPIVCTNLKREIASELHRAAVLDLSAPEVTVTL